MRIVREITISLNYYRNTEGDTPSIITWDAYVEVIQKRFFLTNKILEHKIIHGRNDQDLIAKVKAYIKSSDIPYKVYIQKGMDMNELRLQNADEIFNERKLKFEKLWML